MDFNPLLPMTPLEIKTPEEEIEVQKEYIFKRDSNNYKLEILEQDQHILLKLYDINSLNLFYYTQKYTLKNIVNILKLDTTIYNNWNKMIGLIDEVYSNNKIILQLINNNIHLIINLNNIECSLILYKTDYGINEKLNIIINEINDIKKNNIISIENKLEQIKKAIIDIKNHTKKIIKDNTESIDSLRKKILNNINTLRDNQIIIQSLNDELEIYLIKLMNIKKK